MGGERPAAGPRIPHSASCEVAGNCRPSFSRVEVAFIEELVNFVVVPRVHR